MKPDRRKLQLSYIGVGLVTLLAVLPALRMWVWVSTSWVPLPFWDEWHTPGAQFESWARGTLTWSEMFSQHNESRLFFARLLYFALTYLGGWDVRKEIRVLFFAVCALCLLLLYLLRQARAATATSSLIAWTLMSYICFAPVQVNNFLYGIEIEPLIPGSALLAAAAVNLSKLSFPAKTLFNVTLALIATYSFANGMLVWLLAWPLDLSAVQAIRRGEVVAWPNEYRTRRSRLWWRVIYLLAGAFAIGCYFIDYHRPSYHPSLALDGTRCLDLAHYLILWAGNYFASGMVGPFLLGLVTLILLVTGIAIALCSMWKGADGRAFYPWLLLSLFSCLTGTITAIGRVGFGVDQALDNRYVAFSRFFYLALVGLYFAIYVTLIQQSSPARRTFFLTNLAWVIFFFAILWSQSFRKFSRVAAEHHKSRQHLLHVLEWIDVIPDNPELAAIFPYPHELVDRARFLEQKGILRIPFVRQPLAKLVQQDSPPADDSHGIIESAQPQPDGRILIQGWAFLPEKSRRADVVIIGCETSAGTLKPVTVLETGRRRNDLSRSANDSSTEHAGFSYRVRTGNWPEGNVNLKGWAVDLSGRKAWPLVSAVRLSKSGLQH